MLIPDEINGFKSPIKAMQLVCPICECGNTHHEQTVEFGRIGGEDGPSYTHSPGDAGTYLIPDEENPSSRRDAVRLMFSCEWGHTFALDVIQHKGTTFLRFPVDKFGTDPRWADAEGEVI